MAQAISNKVLVQNNKYCWMICDYTLSGSTMSYTLSFKFEGGCAQLDNAWIKVGGTTVWQNTGRIHNYEGNPAAAGHTVNIHSGTATISGTQTVTFGITKYSGVAMSGSFTATGGSKPSGLSAKYNSSTWNSVSITSTVTNWGSGYNANSQNLEQIVVGSSATSSNWETVGRQVKQNAVGSSMTSTQSVTTANSKAYSGGITIKGAMDFKIAAWASTSVGSQAGGYFNNTVYHTPPSPMTSLTYNQTKNAINVRIGVSTVGGNSTNNYGNTVTTYVRYSTNGGGSYSGWSSMGTGNTWGTYTGWFDCPYGANVIIQTKQAYQGLDSEVKSVSFKATSGDAPSDLSVSITSSTWNSVTLSGSVGSYGNPSSASDRWFALGVNINGSSLSNRRENSGDGQSLVTTVTNSSYNIGGAFDLKGMLPVYPYAYANNTSLSATNLSSSVYYLPPAPGTLSYTSTELSTYTVTYSGSSVNNYDDYTAADLTRTVRYKIGGGAWTYIDNAAVAAVTDVTTDSIVVPFGQTLYVEAWMTYKGKDSEVSSFQISGTQRPVEMYGSVEGATKEIIHFYGPVDGETKKVKKIYGSVGGVAKEIFEDV